MILKVKNFLDQSAPTTYLTQIENTGTATLHVQNAVGPSAQWALQVGKTGEEKSEIVVLNSSDPSGTTYVLAGTTTFDHPTDTPVYGIKYNQIVWKRSTTGTSGTAAAFATTNITPDNDFTQYDDTSGASTYAYKAAYYNSAIGTISSDSDWIMGSGYDFYSLANMRQRMKDKLFSTGFIGDDSIIDGWINEYLELMTNAAIDVNEDYNLGSTNVTFSGTAEMGTIGTADFKSIRRVWMTTNGTDWYVAQKMQPVDVRPNQVFNETMPYYFMYDQNQISRWPHDNGGTAAILYYKLTATMTNESDTLPQTMRGYTKGYVDYCMAQARYKEGKFAEGQAFEASAMAQLDKFKREMTPRNKSQSSTIQILENVGDEVNDLSYRT